MNPELPYFDLQDEVLKLLHQIPSGSVTTYGDLARALGDDKTRSARWVGEFLKDHPHDQDCPCHRVVRLTGEIGLYVGGNPRIKAKLLRSEGIPVSRSGHVDVSSRFTDFYSCRPLEQLREFQKHLSADVLKQRLSHAPHTIAGVDVAYRANGDACGAYVQLDAKTLKVLKEITLKMQVDFPYIAGYLTFRELPVMKELCDLAERENATADVIFCDGNGQLHPWRAGIASCLGVLIDRPVIGVGKSLLCGKVDLHKMLPNESREVRDGDEVIARAIRTSATSKPVYVSVGHRVTLEEATTLVQRTMTKHRVPEPIYFADRLTKELRKT